MIYLIHIDPPVSHAKHYLGWTTPERLAVRLRHHEQGKGARLLLAALERGALVRLVRLWRDGSILEERRIKRTSRLAVHCPVCNEAEISEECRQFMPLILKPPALYEVPAIACREE